jgi:hypothetical protein
MRRAIIIVTTMFAVVVPVATANGGSWNATHHVLCDYWQQQSLGGAVIQCFDGSRQVNGGYWAADLSRHGRPSTGYIHPLPGHRIKLPPRNWKTLPGGGVKCRRGPGGVLVQCRNNSGHGFRFRASGHGTF